MAKRPKRRSSIFAGLFIFALLILIGAHLLTLRQKIDDAQAQKAALDTQLSSQMQENNGLKAALEKADDEEALQQYLQELAQKQLNMVYPGQRDFFDISN